MKKNKDLKGKKITRYYKIKIEEDKFPIVKIENDPNAYRKLLPGGFCFCFRFKKDAVAFRRRMLSSSSESVCGDDVPF